MIDSLLKGWRKSGPLGAMALHALASYKRIKSTSDNVWPSRDTFLHRLVWLPRSGQQGLLCACLDLWRRMRNLCIPWKNLLLCNPSRARSEEHTSELQSLMRISYAVFCLKKKTKTTQRTSSQYNRLSIIKI